MSKVIVSGAFDNLTVRGVRLLQEAARLGKVTVDLWPDSMIDSILGLAAKFPQNERAYFVKALRSVSEVRILPEEADPNAPEVDPADVFMVENERLNPRLTSHCVENRISLVTIPEYQLAGFPLYAEDDDKPGSKKVIVTGCYDWLHSGHVRFFEEASEYGDLYVVAGNDANIQMLKGKGHPLYPENRRRYLVSSIKYVHRALISSGMGWMDAAPEVDLIRPDIYIVNEDGDVPEKQAFCQEHGLEYVVLKRLPGPGLPRRQSTDLRGF